MNQKELKELIEFLIEKDITEFELERGDVKVRIKRGQEPVAHAPAERILAVHSAAPSVPQVPLVAATASESATPVPPTETPAKSEDLHIVHSPIVGTYYESPSPGSPPFVKVGDTVEAGQVLCIVEAMKLMQAELSRDALMPIFVPELVSSHSSSRGISHIVPGLKEHLPIAPAIR